MLALFWRKYRVAMMATLILFAYFWLVSKLHLDFIAYLELAKTDEHLGWSFVVKWAFLIIGIVSYLLFLFLSNRAIHSESSRTSQSEPTSIWEKRDTISPESKVSAREDNKSSDDTPRGDDPFRALRTKPSLRSKSDLVIGKYPEKKV